MTQFNQKGFSPLLLLAAATLILFLTIISMAPFRNEMMSMLFPKDPSFAAPGDALTVNATTSINPFSKQMLGQSAVNWEHTPVWGSRFIGDVPNLSQAFKESGVGVVRYAGGLWANSVGWDRTNQKTPYTAWTKNGQTYYFHYGMDEIASLNAFADAVGAEVMIQVNIATNDPAMWADMVRFANIERGYNFKYWELGNEFEVAADLGITPDIYASRIRDYIDAMKAVDPSIKIISGVPGSAHDGPRQGWSDAVTEMSQYLSRSAAAVSPQGRKTDDLSYHWYQACNSSGFAEMTNWQFPGLATNSWRNGYSRIWSQIAPSRVQNEIIAPNGGVMRQGITELNFDACNFDHPLNANHMSALWASDVLGRLAYNGLDFVTWYEGYGGQGYSTVYPDNPTPPVQLFVRPSYYAFYMYNKYFGDQMVQSSSFDNSQISIWASTDSKDPGKLKLRITNISANPITVPINLTGFNASTGAVYTLQSTNPTDTTASSNTANASTSINGVKLNGNNVAQSAAAIQPVSINVNGSSFTHTFPAYTTTAIVLNPASASPLPSSSPSPSATPQTFYASLNASQEVQTPAVNSLATGTGTVVLAGNQQTAAVNLSFSGLTSTQTMTHIHGPASAGQNSGILFTLPNGSFSNHQITLTPTQATQLKNGQFYFNVHTVNFANGEIRGQITTSPPSPSPLTSSKPGDTDGDNDVDIFDYNILLTNFGQTGSNNPGDIDKNGRVDIFDYNILLTNFGK